MLQSSEGGYERLEHEQTALSHIHDPIISWPNWHSLL